ncbi:PPPDE putative peptidase domain-containing protein [Pelagophyceae sp. CCMP2097]|nr:PPPDE putative peptidase domain-containing protein [Pelagophyceae sp. CCMP2097]|mmetsp:Transcript_30510/g.105417  ORF Transcript_30510/g.105417 Transcript_30510/m.105417 type:complete len:350 (-) Transcript_30510:98-1147(-)
MTGRRPPSNPTLFYDTDSDGEANGPEITVNVYDIADVGLGFDLGGMLASLNLYTLSAWEVGIFHAGVEIDGVEYSYGFCERGTGVFTCEPRRAYGAKFRKAIKLGRARRDYRSIERRITRLVRLWHGHTYALLTRNCCHFCDELTQGLGVGALPEWINGMAASLSKYGDWGLGPGLDDRKTQGAFRAHHAGPHAALLTADADAAGFGEPPAGAPSEPADFGDGDFDESDDSTNAASAGAGDASMADAWKTLPTPPPPPRASFGGPVAPPLPPTSTPVATVTDGAFVDALASASTSVASLAGMLTGDAATAVPTKAKDATPGDALRYVLDEVQNGAVATSTARRRAGAST